MTVTERDQASTPSTPAFPVVWDDPADALCRWRLDARYDGPLPPLEYAVAARAYTHGFNVIARAHGLPLRARSRCINGRLYHAFAPLSGSPAALEAQIPPACESIAAADLGHRWERDLLPEIERALACWRRFDLVGAGLPQLIAHFDETAARVDRLWEIAWQVRLVAGLAAATFSELYAALFGRERAHEAALLLRGEDSNMRLAERALRRLSRQARALPIARDALRWCADHEVLAALMSDADGRALLGSLRHFLQHYGRRADGGMFIAAPTWLEDPRPLIHMLREQALQPDRDVEAEEAACGDARCRLEAEVCAQLARERPVVAAQFTRLLRAARDAARLREECVFWIEQQSMAEVRRLVLALGRRLAEAGAIATPADVLFLDLRELRATAETLLWADQRARIARRQRELQGCRALAAPPELGASFTDPISTTLERLLALAAM
jgi:pyruvate,water dikinase